MKNIQSEGSIPILVKCACGCGREFKPKYKWHEYFETKCRVKAFFERQAKNTESDKLKAMEKRLEKLEEKLSDK